VVVRPLQPVNCRNGNELSVGSIDVNPNLPHVVELEPYLGVNTYGGGYVGWMDNQPLV
jgi:hypothetical protein